MAAKRTYPTLLSHIAWPERTISRQGRGLNTMAMAGFDRDAVLLHAKLTVLWSLPVNEEDFAPHLDEFFYPSDITGDMEDRLLTLIEAFLEQADGLLRQYPFNEEELGRDLILTVNHHGTGFYNRGLGKLGEDLTEVCRGLPAYRLYMGEEDEQLHYLDERGAQDSLF